MPPHTPTTLSRRSFLKVAGVASAAAALPRHVRADVEKRRAPAGSVRELRADIVIVGGSFGGVAAALAAARAGRRVIMTEETGWIGGQATTQGVPLDEHPWIEQYGCTQSYRDFRNGVRDYYRRLYPLTPAARADHTLNPGAGWVTALGFEPRAGLAVLYEMLAPHLAAGRITILTRHRPIAVAMAGDHIEAVTVRDEGTGADRTLSAPYILDATELGDVLELGQIEHVIGAEARAETGEPNALEGPANPLDQMAYTHVFALDYLPGEEHVIEQPRDYDFWRNQRNPLTGRPKLQLDDLFGVRQDHFGRPVDPKTYLASTWSFRRALCRTNFAAGAFESDVTTAVWGQNEYREGVLLGVPLEEQRRHLDAARQLSLSLIYWLQTEAPDLASGRTGFPGLRPRGDVFDTVDGLAQYPYIRESRRIRAEFMVRENDFRVDGPANRDGPVKYADTVGVGGYRIDIHKPAPKGGRSLTESNHGRHWCQQIPLGALLPVRVENLLPACKNLGVTAVVNGAFRLHPVEWNIGEAAGALAAFCLNRNLKPRQVRNTPALLADFQRELVRGGVELDWPQRETARSYYSHHNVELKDTATFYFGEASRL